MRSRRYVTTFPVGAKLGDPYTVRQTFWGIRKLHFRMTMSRGRQIWVVGHDQWGVCHRAKLRDVIHVGPHLSIAR